MHCLLIFLTVLQISYEPLAAPAVRGDRFQIFVPQGWRTLNDGGYVLLEHSSGASLLVQRVIKPNNLPDYAQRQAERIMLPLGFARLGETQSFKNGRDEWIQYEIRGNRLTAHRRILYRALRRDTGFFEVIYEAADDQFDLLLTEAEGIASSVQATIQAPPARRARR